MKIVVTAFVCLMSLLAQCQKQVVVHFLYGSVPGKSYTKTEKKRFGGKKGGHVSIQLGDSIIGFQPKGSCHITAQKRTNGYFRSDSLAKWQQDSIGDKYTSIIIPISTEQYRQLKNKLDNDIAQTPYDYAVFGMRCAAATYNALQEIGIVPPIKSNTGTWTKYFYPQLLRRKMLKLAEEKNYTVVRKQGRASRKWEME